jgi:hypothetical protein
MSNKQNKGNLISLREFKTGKFQYDDWLDFINTYCFSEFCSKNISRFLSNTYLVNSIEQVFRFPMRPEHLSNEIILDKPKDFLFVSTSSAEVDSDDDDLHDDNPKSIKICNLEDVSSKELLNEKIDVDRATQSLILSLELMPKNEFFRVIYLAASIGDLIEVEN